MLIPASLLPFLPATVDQDDAGMRPCERTV